MGFSQDREWGVMVTTSSSLLALSLRVIPVCLAGSQAPVGTPSCAVDGQERECPSVLSICPGWIQVLGHGGSNKLFSSGLQAKASGVLEPEPGRVLAALSA